MTAASAAEGLTPEERTKAKVFDVAAGTGLCALQVSEDIRDMLMFMKL